MAVEGIDASLIPFATASQAEAIRAYLKHQSKAQAAKEIGIRASSLHNLLVRVKKRAVKQGWSPGHDWTHPVPDGHFCKGVSSFYGADGELKGQWVKTQVDREALEGVANELAEGMFADRKPLKPVKPPKQSDRDQMATYVLADLHLGMLADSEETGDDDWDCKIAVQCLSDAFDRLISRSPQTETCVIANLGDLMHVDDESNQTKRSNNALDVDSRHWRVARVAGNLVRHVVDRALMHHKKVRFVNVKGNHDWTSADLLGLAIEHAYEQEKRVEIDNSPGAYHYHRFGSTLIGMTHGHTCKPADLGGVMMSDRRADCGECQHIHWLTGHIHHETRKELSWYTHESFRSPASKDAFHAKHGYRSKRDMVAIVYHKSDGETDRNRVLVRPPK